MYIYSMKWNLSELHNLGYTPKKAAEYLGVKYCTLLPHWKKQGLPLQGSGGQNRIICHNPFEDWGEVAQYWFGYIVGDGNISTEKYSIAVYSQELDHLQKYADWLGLKIHISGLKGTVLFGNKQVHQWFIERGVTPNKSLDVRLDVALTPHIVRGLFDADGCGRRGGNPNKITSGSLRLLEQIQKYLYSKEIESVIHVQCGRTYCINIKRSSDTKFFELLYSNATVYMQRKYDRVSRSASKIG